MVLAELGGKLRESLRKLSSNNSSPIDTKQFNAILSEISRALIESDVNARLVMTLRNNIKNKVGKLVEEAEASENISTAHAMNIRKTIQRSVVSELTDMLSPNVQPHKYKKGKANVILFVGLQGAGKTTSIAKFANYYQRRGWKTAMVCADTFRAGAFDQLKQNATKLRVPFYGSYTEADPVAIAEDGVNQFADEGYEIIIVDTSGRHKQESALFEEMQEISSVVRPDNTVFVMDATQGQAVFDQALAFHDAVDVGSVIVTKLDGHAKGGGALSAVAATNSPIIFLGSGEHFDDFDPFNAQSFVNKLLGYGDMRGFMEEMKSVQGGKTQEDLMKNFAKGQFTLRDMYKQFESIMKMGPLNKVMGMLPGVPEYLIPKGNDDESTNRLKKFMFMMDSMTDAELDGKVDFKKEAHTDHIKSRVKRIAMGSGTHPMEVKMLLQAHQQFEGVVSKVGKSGMMKGMNPRMAEQMKRNPQMMQQLQRQMGGMGMGGMPGGGMPDMATMAKMMKGMGMGGGRGGMPNMAAMESMMKQMGGAGGMSGMGGLPGMQGMGGGMPDMAAMAKMMQDMGMGGGRR